MSSRKRADCAVVAALDRRERWFGAEAAACHIGNLEDIAAIFAHIRAVHGRLDIPGTTPRPTPISDMCSIPIPVRSRRPSMNIRGYFFMSVEGARLMREHGGGSIVNTASINGLQPAPGQAIYSITKAAVINMTKAFARECGEFNIRVNALLPGLTKTRFAGALFDNPEIHREIIGRVPLGRHALPDEMAGTVLYLVSAAASYTTGECIVVDGGVTI
ncbi:MAG: SDR family oxidoreductase [Gammaproteobacteria bacterium]|nr:SDR family oxidoreductase [Gammaproteobacteria bacterium]